MPVLLIWRANELLDCEDDYCHRFRSIRGNSKSSGAVKERIGLTLILVKALPHHECHRPRLHELAVNLIHHLGRQGVVVVDPPGH